MKITKYGIVPFLFGLVVFFMLMDVFFIGIAVKTFSGVQTENAYQKGVDFDKIHNQEIYDKDIGWKVKLHLNDLQNKIQLDLSDKVNVPITGAKIQAKIISPVTAKFDQALFLKEVSEGKYEANFQPKYKGQFEVRIKAVVGKIEYITSEKFNTKH